MNSAGHVTIRPDSWPNKGQWPTPKGLKSLTNLAGNPDKNWPDNPARDQNSKFFSSPTYLALYPAKTWPDSWPDLMNSKFAKILFFLRSNSALISNQAKHIEQVITNLICTYHNKSTSYTYEEYNYRTHIYNIQLKSILEIKYIKGFQNN